MNANEEARVQRVARSTFVSHLGIGVLPTHDPKTRQPLPEGDLVTGRFEDAHGLQGTHEADRTFAKGRAASFAENRF